MLAEARIGNHKFYSVLPNLDFPQMIYSELSYRSTIGQVEKELSQLQSRKMERYEAYRSGEISREDFHNNQRKPDRAG